MHGNSAGLTIRQSRQLPTGPAPLGAPQPWAAKKKFMYSSGKKKHYVSFS